MLGLVLSNDELVQRGHQATEDIHKLFRFEHPAILQGVGRLYEGTDRIEAVSHGVALFESSIGFVGDLPQGEIEEIYKWVHALMYEMDKNYLASYMERSVEGFKTKMPRMVEVTQEASARHYSYLTEYAILGASMSWQVALDSTAN